MPELVDRPLLAPTGEAAAAWPSEVRAELHRRGERLRTAVEGLPPERRLDLADPEALARVLDAGRAGSARPSGAGQVEVVLSVGALVAVADLPLALRGIERLLGPDGRLRFVEPVARPGWAGVLAASAGALLGPVRDQHLGRDIPRAVRTAGLVITDLERFTMPTPVWPLRSFVEGDARPRAGLVR